MKAYLSIGEVSRRSGLSVSALHFYERRGLISPERNGANHRVYRRDVLRRVSIIRVAQGVGLSLAEIGAALASLPTDRTPDTEDWARIARDWHDDLSRRIELLRSLRDDLACCIGCGCLSVKNCPLVNTDDRLGRDGPGARLL